MKRFRKIKEKILLHPMMSFILMAGFVVVLSGILNIFDASVTYNKINSKTGLFESSLLTVESLFNLSGLKYIFSNTVSNFVSFAPLSMLLITLIGIGIMDKSGFLDTLFFVLTKKMSKITVTYIFVLLCILAGIVGDLSFIIFIPIGALLFKYGKRNPMVGIITAFAGTALGYGINIFISSVTSSLIEYTESAASAVTANYVVNSNCYLLIMIPALIISSIIITYVTEKFTVPKLGKYVTEEEVVIKEKLSKREVRGLIFAGAASLIYLIIFIYNIIPNAPLGGKLLDYSQVRYIDKLFGYQSFFNSGFVFVVTLGFFLCGLFYGLGAKTISNHRDMCNYLSHSLDGIGKVIVMIFFASLFISLLKYTNIGTLITGLFANVLNSTTWTGIPLIILAFVVSFVTALFAPTFIVRWPILSASLVPTMMTAGFSAEYAQLVFTAASTSAYALTPAMAYFVIYISFLEKYDKEGVGITKGIKYMLPYSIGMTIMWLFLLILWYLIGIPLGISTPTLL